LKSCYVLQDHYDDERNNGYITSMRRTMKNRLRKRRDSVWSSLRQFQM